MESIGMVMKLLTINSPLQDKARGLALARQYDDQNVNEALVDMLGDKSPGGRVSHDEAVEMPWIESMHILAKRFPEAGIKINIDYRYTQKDRTAFLGWWSENRGRIKYLGNTHVLELAQATSAKAAGFSKHSVNPSQHDKKATSVDSDKPPHLNSPPTVQPPAPKNAPEATPTTSTQSD
jgi:hypothetical protein